MAKAFKPNDLQLILLSTAARREGGYLIPLPDSVVDERERATNAAPLTERPRKNPGTARETPQRPEAAE